MRNKTEGVRILVQDVLQAFSEPYGEDIILHVFQKIAEDPNFQKRYTQFRDELGKYGVNPWIGKYTKELTGMKSLYIHCHSDVSLVKTYTKLGH